MNSKVCVMISIWFMFMNRNVCLHLLISSSRICRDPSGSITTYKDLQGSIRTSGVLSIYALSQTPKTKSIRSHKALSIKHP